jgi:hypothetical protein
MQFTTKATITIVYWLLVPIIIKVLMSNVDPLVEWCSKEKRDCLMIVHQDFTDSFTRILAVATIYGVARAGEMLVFKIATGLDRVFSKTKRI